MTRRLRAVLCALALVLAAPRAAEAVPAHTLRQRAAEAEARRDWGAAIRALEELTAAGLDGDGVLYNLGTAYAQAGRYGEAIACFERVVRRTPFALSADRNLQATRLRLARRDAARTGHAVMDTPPPLWVQLGEVLPLDYAVPWVFLCELCLLGAFLWRRRADTELARVGATAALALSLVAGGTGVAVVIARRAAPPAAIVLRDGLSLLQGARVDAVPEAPLREGERVSLQARDGAFVRVVTRAGRAGWVRAADLAELGP